MSEISSRDHLYFTRCPPEGSQQMSGMFTTGKVRWMFYYYKDKKRHSSLWNQQPLIYNFFKTSGWIYLRALICSTNRFFGFSFYELSEILSSFFFSLTHSWDSRELTKRRNKNTMRGWFISHSLKGIVQNQTNSGLSGAKKKKPARQSQNCFLYSPKVQEYKSNKNII